MFFAFDQLNGDMQKPGTKISKIELLISLDMSSRALSHFGKFRSLNLKLRGLIEKQITLNIGFRFSQEAHETVDNCLNLVAKMNCKWSSDFRNKSTTVFSPTT